MALGSPSGTFVDIVNGIKTRFTALAVSLGAASAGQVVGLNSSGKVDISMMATGPDAFFVRPPTSCYAFLNSSRNGALSTFSPGTSGKQLFYPFFVPAITLVTNLGTHVTTASSSTTFSVGIYANNTGSGTSDAPTGSPLASVTNLSSGTAGMVVGALNAPITLYPNTLYWLSLVGTSSTVAHATISGALQMGYNLGLAGLVTGYSATSSGSTLLAPIGSTTLTQIANSPIGFAWS